MTQAPRATVTIDNRPEIDLTSLLRMDADIGITPEASRHKETAADRDVRDRAYGIAAIAVAMIPFLLAAILFSFFGLQRRKWQRGGQD